MNGGGGVGGPRMAATATVVGIPSVEVRSELYDVIDNDVTVPLLSNPLAKNCMIIPPHFQTPIIHIPGAMR